MTNPAFYRTSPFGSVHFMEVAIGTVVKDERSGQSVTIDDNTAAFKGNVCFCTKKMVEAIKASVSEEPRP